MEALTLLLDQVTPFWRTYGKVIGEDIQDFLIIPLYRNEFTGETKRYPIKHFPRRSLRHWLVLLLFFTFASSIMLLQARAAMTSAYHFRLAWIAHGGARLLALPFFWISILIQWCAVLLELCIVLSQLAVVAWWIGWTIRLLD